MWNHGAQGDALRIAVNDDLSGLVTHFFVAQGRRYVF
jgi:hypothetical protein